MDAFSYQEPFPLGPDKTDYRCVTQQHVSTAAFEGQKILKVSAAGLTLLAEVAFKEVSHRLRPGHLEKVAAILKDPDASENDRAVALEMIKNAVIAAEGVFPLCQDTGTAIVIGKKGQQVWTAQKDEAALSRGIFKAFRENNWRYSQNAPLSMFEERNTGCNLPAQIELYATAGDAYRFLMIAKGGGSANKVYLFQETRALLNRRALAEFMKQKMQLLGTAACPPYHLAVVIGGLSAESNLKTLKLATTGDLDGLPDQGAPGGHAFRDREMEQMLLRQSRELGLGAQFGGKHFCLDTRVIRLPRHGASLPVGVGVSCSADRNIKAKITSRGIFVERLEDRPERFLPKAAIQEREAVSVDLDQPMDQLRATLTQYPVTTPLRLNGSMIVARDIAHARLKERLDRGEGLPDYFREHIIYYAGPAKTPEGYASGSFGPTTAARMDPYVPLFQEHGGSMVMLAKGNRSKTVVDACKRYGGFYLGSIGGPAARLGKECISRVEIVDYADLGMEAVYAITVKDFPAFILIDDKGNDFFERLL